MAAMAAPTAPPKMLAVFGARPKRMATTVTKRLQDIAIRTGRRIFFFLAMVGLFRDSLCRPE